MTICRADPGNIGEVTGTVETEMVRGAVDYM